MSSAPSSNMRRIQEEDWIAAVILLEMVIVDPVFMVAAANVEFMLPEFLSLIIFPYPPRGERVRVRGEQANIFGNDDTWFSSKIMP